MVVAMRLNAALASALLSSATLMGYARADETESSSTTETSSTSTSTSDIERPTFTVCQQFPMELGGASC